MDVVGGRQGSFDESGGMVEVMVRSGICNVMYCREVRRRGGISCVQDVQEVIVVAHIDTYEPAACRSHTCFHRLAAIM